MCGFAGFISPDATLDRRAVIHAMADSIAHRGPDSQGYYIDERAALGFRRLALVDIKGGSQPLFNEDGSLVLCFNGEIYNHRALRAELERAGHRFTTETDSEVLVHGYEQWGARLLGRLRGMFAFVIYDKREGSLFAARDGFGIKPFYYAEGAPRAEAGATLLFASEIKALLFHPAFPKHLNERRLPHYLCFEYLPDEETLFEGVRKLPAGHWMRWQDGKRTLQRWWTPSYEADETLCLGEWAERISGAVRDSVSAHAFADAEVGAFLSAGVDSSLIAAEAAKLMDVRTFSVGYSQKDELAYSELDAAKAFARTAGLRNEGRAIGAADFFAAVPAVQYAMDEPLPNPSAVPLWFLARFAAESVKAVLSGEGADELFGGYPYYQECLAFERYGHLPEPLRRVAAHGAAALPPFHGRRFLMRGAHPLPVRYLRNNYVFDFAETNTYLREDYDACPPEALTAPAFAVSEGLDEVTAMQLADIRTWMQQDILLKADKMTMAASLELRVPFLDREVFAVARALPARYRTGGRETKIALRRAAALTLPPATAAMPKKGFLTPLNQWLRSEPFATHVREVLLDSNAARRYLNREAVTTLLQGHIDGTRPAMKKVWSLYCLCLWYEEYFVKR